MWNSVFTEQFHQISNQNQLTKSYDKIDAENTFSNVWLNLRHKFYDQNLEGLVTTIVRPFLDFFAYYQ